MDISMINRTCIALVLFIALLSGCANDQKLYDIIIRSGTIVDGTGNPGYRADIGIREDQIAEIGKIPENMGKQVIDARGLTVVPGFIDVHTHADRRIDTQPEAKNYLLQGEVWLLRPNPHKLLFPPF